jgi:hypothetical protein
MAFDYIFKRMMRELLRSCDAKPEEVGNLPLKIDTVARCKDAPANPPLIPLLENHFSKDNLLEYKSSRDKMHDTDLSKLLGYIGLFCDQQGIDILAIPMQVTAWYIVARRPSILERLVAANIAGPTNNTGVYEVSKVFPCPCRVLVIDELDTNDANIPLLLLGSEETIKKAIRYLARAGASLRNAVQTYINLIYLFYHDEVKDMTEMNEILPPDIRRNMKHAIEDLGLEEMINEIGIDKVITAVGIDKMITAVGIDKMITAVGIEKLEIALAKAKTKANLKPKKLK